jgi:hypothetical protein
VQPGPAGERKAACAGVNQRATVGLQQVSIDPQTHQLLPRNALDDYGVYPADNFDVLQGVVKGPIGNHTLASFAVAGVWEFENTDLPCVPLDPQGPSDCSYDPRQAQTPSRLEAILVVPGDPTIDGDLGWTKTFNLESQRNTTQQEALLLSVERLSVVYSEKSDEFEYWTQARFAMGCHGAPYTEGFKVSVHGQEVTVTPRMTDLLGLPDGTEDPFGLGNLNDLITEEDLTNMLQQSISPPPVLRTGTPNSSRSPHPRIRERVAHSQRRRGQALG